MINIFILELSCVCNEKSVIIHEESGYDKNCTTCRPGTIPAPDRKHCLPCKISNLLINNTSNCGFCKQNEILIENHLDGSSLNESKCIACANGTIPIANQCQQCPIINPYMNKQGKFCFCPLKTSLKGQVCVPDSLIGDFNIRNSNPFEVDLFAENYVVESLHLKEYLYPNLHLCRVSRSKNGNWHEILNFIFLFWS